MDNLSRPQCGRWKTGGAGAPSATRAKQPISVGPDV